MNPSKALAIPLTLALATIDAHAGEPHGSEHAESHPVPAEIAQIRGLTGEFIIGLPHDAIVLKRLDPAHDYHKYHQDASATNQHDEHDVGHGEDPHAAQDHSDGHEDHNSGGHGHHAAHADIPHVIGLAGQIQVLGSQDKAEIGGNIGVMGPEFDVRIGALAEWEFQKDGTTHFQPYLTTSFRGHLDGVKLDLGAIATYAPDFKYLKELRMTTSWKGFFGNPYLVFPRNLEGDAHHEGPENAVGGFKSGHTWHINHSLGMTLWTDFNSEKEIMLGVTVAVGHGHTH